jgi:GDP-4-dehydro-6-deoxy-D-mannose reductase
MRVLITGAGGFAGRHMTERAMAEGAEVIAPPREELDLRDAEATRAAVALAAPDRIFHLAALASVPESWEAPAETIGNNLDATLAVLEAVRREAPHARVLIAGSGEMYGPPQTLPVDESHPIRPQNPYAVSKAAGDILGGFYEDGHDLHVIRSRAFNHSGPGQSDLWVIGAFARQIAEAEARGDERAEIVTGGLDARRDFTDVRDVVRAYWLLLEKADPGAYNVCRGESIEVASILDGLAKAARLEVEPRIDPARLRKNEVMEIIGSHEKLTAATGWQPEIPIEQTLRDALDWWRSQVTA